MLVREAMVKGPITIGPDEAVIEAAKTIREKSIGSLIVTEKENVLGIITERDLVRRVMAEDDDPKTVKVRHVMSSPVISISPEKDVIDAAQLMKKRGIRRLVVMDGDKLVVYLHRTTWPETYAARR